MVAPREIQPPNITNVPTPLIIRIRNVTIRVIKNSIKNTWFSCVHVGKIFGPSVFHSDFFVSASPPPPTCRSLGTALLIAGGQNLNSKVAYAQKWWI